MVGACCDPLAKQPETAMHGSGVSQVKTGQGYNNGVARDRRATGRENLGEHLRGCADVVAGVRRGR